MSIYQKVCPFGDCEWKTQLEEINEETYATYERRAVAKKQREGHRVALQAHLIEAHGVDQLAAYVSAYNGDRVWN